MYPSAFEAARKVVQDAAKQAELAEEAKQRQHLETFVERFHQAAANLMIKPDPKPWVPEAFEQGVAYATWLTETEDSEAPTTGGPIMEKLNGLFVSRFVNDDNRILDEHFVGQRQDWFAPMLNKFRKNRNKKQDRPTNTGANLQHNPQMPKTVTIPESDTPSPANVVAIGKATPAQVAKKATQRRSRAEAKSG